MRRYRMDCPAALHRLVVGVPATVEHSTEAGAGEGEEIGKWVAETTQVGRLPLLTSNICLLPFC
jgi:ESCRT-I complex subunit VPS28